MKRLVIVGGVAGGASAATRARRLAEDAEIILLERGPYVSFANCGMPYWVGGEIAREEQLLIQTPESLRARFRLDVRVWTEATRIDREAQVLEGHNRRKDEEYRLPYDALILSTGAAPLKPPIPGIDRSGHFTLRSIPDVEAIVAWTVEQEARRAVVVGGGYIGLEMAEQLRRRGLEVAVAEVLPQVMTPLDPEMAAWLHQELAANGVELHLGDGVAAFEAPRPGEDSLASTVVLRSGARLPADVVILGLGVKPDVALAREAGLEIGALGGIRVDAGMRTSDPRVWAVGDAVEVRHAVTGGWSLLPLAGPANRQGRIAADNVFGRASRYEATFGTAILRLFRLVAGCTGANETALRRAGIPYEVLYLHPSSHAGYYPGAEPLAMKVLFTPGSGVLLGAQIVGRDGVDKRIDVLATALKASMGVHQLSELELAYAPPFGAAKDPVDLAGMAADNVLAGDLRLAQWHEVASLDPDAILLLDVRGDDERAAGSIPGSAHIPLPALRDRLEELPSDRELVVYCQSGQRSYYACRILEQHGFRTRNLTGGYRTWKAANAGHGKR
jgi:NADPH-dependent 2,4-dienoyl-CoA reductase/sulfur reductase-like enzyme/rhodanese-related sulfurtransferase